ncbi:MAG: chitobiase/beta-hexosaminidase C-terminal domain-containing protein [Acidobacteriaceae bacterium]
MSSTSISALAQCTLSTVSGRTSIGSAAATRASFSRSLKSATWKFRPWLLLCITLGVLAVPSGLRAQQLEPIPALSFSTTFGEDNPLAQMITVNSTGATFNFTAAATTNSGGSWLAITPSAYGYGVATPFAITVSAAPAVTLAAGTYTGQIVITPVTTTISPITIPVTLVIHATTATYFDQIAGGLTFAELTAGDAPPGQALQVRNAGAGTLAWTATTSTADGGAWLSLSAVSGTAPSNLTVSVVPSKFPGEGLVAGTFTGQVLLKTTGDSITIPVTVNVGANIFRQVNPLRFVKTFAGANSLSQTITMASTGTNFTFAATVQNSTGGTWLTITPSAYGYGIDTPQAITVGVNPAVTLAAGTYMAEVIVNSEDGHQGFSIPVTLVINPDTAAYFDDVAGDLSYSMETSGDAPPAQEIQIRDAGAGTLSWTASATTADGGSWLTLSEASGSAPADVSVTVNPKNLPNAGQDAGTFVGQVLLQNATGDVTVPVVYTVGANAFRQVNPLTFTKVFAGANPLPQVITIASTGTNFTFDAVAINSTGGNWLQISPSAYGYGISTPSSITVSVNPAVTLAAGTYSSEVVVESEDGTQVMNVPVTLVIEAATDTFFDALPGQMSFTMVTKGDPPPAQVLPIRNAGAGTLDWTATAITSDGGDWLTLSAASGTAPSNPTVTVVPGNLPGGGLVAGTFSGQIVLESNGAFATIPVSMVVGANVFRQISPLNFTMTYGGGNPLPQVLTVASTGTNFTFLASVANSTGGNWLTISPSAYGYGISTPEAITVTANPAVTLAAGTYSAQIIIESADGTQTITVPVTLTIVATTAAHFDSLPGALSFSMVTGGTAPPAQPVEIRNEGAGSLAWTASLSTADGGGWLSISAATGTAPTVPQISVIPSKLPGLGLVAGTFTGQVILETATDRVTIPVSMVVGTSVFRQVNALDFNMTAGGASPLFQLINITSTGASFTFLASVANSTGGNWLAINPSAYGYGLGTPQNLIVTVNPAATLAAGTYSAQIIVIAAAGSPSMVIPVTLRVNAPTSIHFNDVTGGVSFFQVTSGATPAAQAFSIRNAGAGTLIWTATATTADGGAWLGLSTASGTAPENLSVSLNSANLPGEGLVAGIFSGQILLQSGTDRQSIPVQVVVGANVFTPLAPLSFSKLFNGSNPTYQLLNVASSATNFAFYGTEASATGGSWITINPSAYGYGISTPESVQVAVDPVTTLAAGEYVGEVIFTSTAGDQGMVVPVTLTVTTTTATATPTFTPAAGTYSTAQMVTIADATPGAAIYYTLNGATPTTASTVYSVPLTVTPTATVKAIALAPGYVQSAVGSATYKLPVAATPQLSVTAGTYTTPQSVTITDATTGATIYYTTNGTAPTTASTKYTGPVTVSSDETIEAIATATGYSQSAVATAAYTIDAPLPVFAPPAGTYTSAQSVTITDSASGATIYYTTNGTAPTTSSTKYTGAITVSSDESVEAIATAPNYGQSPVATAAYTIDAASPVIAPPAGNYAAAQSVTITDTTTGAAIYYTTNGTAPTTSSTKYTGTAITVSSDETIEAIATATGYGQGPVTTAVYTIEVAPPVISPKGGNYATEQSVTITDATTGATIYYTTNGTAPTTSSTKYTGAITVASNETIEAIATAPNYSQSAVSTAIYTIDQAATPHFSPAAGTYAAAQTVTITDGTTGATIYYTTNGTAPTTSSTRYTGPITVSSDETIEAIATATGYTQSAVATAKYSIEAAEPAASQVITISEATSGATVYYTTDGSTPTTSSTKYTGPLTVTATTTLKFIAVAPNYVQSPVRTIIVTVE